ncbi:MAG: hypothetical protein CME62_06570 [Halobacteriovoraceae bacterium]|nr:hypothetical protein [Halobacteriovoraceae bacterium]|tara:strand:+ start:30264 stop:33311 length:3048 start_codon:yes stop_codon:yes gene_type:complete
MKSSVFIIFICSILSTSILASDLNCNQLETTKNFKGALSLIQTKISKVQAVLNGKKVDGVIFREIFGLDFDLSKTSTKISSIKNTIYEFNGVALENRTIANCLKQAEQQEKWEQLTSASTQLRELEIQLLQRNLELSDSLRESNLTETSIPRLREQIVLDSQTALGIKNKLENDLLRNQKEALKNTNEEKQDLLSLENELTKIKIELLEKKITFNNNLETKIKYFENLNEKLATSSSHLSSQNRDELVNHFISVQELWLKLSEENYQDLFRFDNNLELPTIPPLEGIEERKNTEKLRELRTELVQLRLNIVQSYTEKKYYELKLLNQLVTSSNAIRTRFFRKLGYSYFFKTFLSTSSFQLIKNEILNAPYRILSYFYSKFLYVREQISIGQKGYVNIFSKIFGLILIFSFLAMLKVLYGKGKERLDSFLQTALRQNPRSYFWKKTYFFWVKIRDISIPLMWLFTLHLIDDLAIVSEIHLLFKVVEIYLWSIILKSFLTSFLGSVSRLDSTNFSAFRIKAEETSNKFKNIFLIYFYTMIFFEITVGKVYIYTLINIIVLAYSVYSLIMESSRWESEFSVYTEKKFSGVIVEKYFQLISFLPSQLRAFFILLFIIVFKAVDFVISLTENFEISKKLSANLFKKQIEKVEAEEGEDNKIPHEYKELYSPKSIDSSEEYVFSAQGLEEKLHGEVQEWLNESSDEHSLVVYGDKGIGKTTLLKKVAAMVGEKEELEVHYAKVPSKTISKESLVLFISEILTGQRIQEEDVDFYEIDRNSDKKKLVILDEAQNIFLSHTGGFEAYYALTNLVNYNTKNVFWILSFNKYSWLYLDRAFGRTQFFRNIFELKGWTDTKIKELILKRHAKSQYKLSYDLLISATKSQDEIDKYSSVESKFFKLLWEMSNGNPRSALFLWISALSRKNRIYFNVNIPKDVDLAGLEKLPDDLMFVVAHVIKHENLTSSEIAKTTGLPEGIVRNAIRLALENKFFFRDKGHRYMVDISTQYGVTKYLRLKNFIYGN